jgi:hypothetical protein
MYLWHGCKGKTANIPKLENRVSKSNIWPSHASDDWISKLYNIMKELDQSELGRYKKYLIEDSYAGSFHNQRMETMKEMALELWPKRLPIEYDVIGDGSIKPISISQWEILMSTESKRLGAPSKEEVYARIGLDPQIVSIIGEENITKLKIEPELWMRYTSVLTPSEINERYALSNVALRALASYHSSYLLNWVMTLGKELIIIQMEENFNCSNLLNMRDTVYDGRLCNISSIHKQNHHIRKNDIFRSMEFKLLKDIHNANVQGCNMILVDIELEDLIYYLENNNIKINIIAGVDELDSNDWIVLQTSKIKRYLNKGEIKIMNSKDLLRMSMAIDNH